MVVEEHLSKMTSIPPVVEDLRGLLTPLKYPRGHPGSLHVYGENCIRQSSIQKEKQAGLNIHI